MSDTEGKNFLVIVESGAKAKTITNFLDTRYIVLPSIGHIRNLKKEYDFKNVLKDGCHPEYENSKDKLSVIKNLKDCINKDTIVYLASDEDREGEAIAWHLIQALKIDPARTKRIAFHEITKPAILHALANPRPLDILTVEAQQARQVLDKGVGYALSPVLWQKVQRNLSCGRVQSVAVRIIIDRENEIRAFKPEEYWKFKAFFNNPELKAELLKKDGKVCKMDISSREIAEGVEADLNAGTYKLVNIEEKNSTRLPQPPFVTSTLQQEASTTLGFSVDTTMKIAQQLYEGKFNSHIPNHEGGLITYMRTDSLNLSTIALDAIRDDIISRYGKEYSLPNHRSFKTKSKGAQEAHEAIRPTNVALFPDNIRSYLDDYQYRLYKLIWNRAVATQMAPAIVANTTYKIEAGKDKNYEFVSKGSRIVFPGFLKISKLKDDVVLPSIELNTILNLDRLEKEQTFTTPPSRYTEASFVKKLEDLGIGRPSTFASTITTILNRKYVEVTEDKKLKPTDIGEATNKFLIENFPEIVCIEFTANMEKDLDRIALGQLSWKKMIEEFAAKLMEDVKTNMGNKDKDYHAVRVVGIHPETNLEIRAVVLKFGPTLVMGTKENNNIKYASIPPGRNSGDISIEEAVKLFKLPREAEVDGVKGKLAIGKFGPYLSIGGKFYSIPREDDILTVTNERLKEIITAEDIRKANAPKDKPKFVKKWPKKK